MRQFSRSLPPALLSLVLPALAPSLAGAVEFTDVDVGRNAVCGVSAGGDVVCQAFREFNPPGDLPPVSSAESGVAHSCALTLEGEVRCWGRNNFGVLDVPDFDAPIARLSVGTNTNCALDAAGQPACWGLDRNGQASPPDSESGFARIATGIQHGCGIRLSGETVCWGRTNPERLTPPAGVAFTELALGGDSCGLSGAGEIRCWGVRPPVPPSNPPYTALAFGESAGEGAMVCGLDLAGEVDCAFTVADGDEAVGDAAEEIEATRAELPEGGGYTAIDARAYDGFVGLAGCAVGGDGDIDCWGRASSPSDIRPFAPRLSRAEPISPGVVELAWFSSDSSLSFDVLRDGEPVAEGLEERRFTDDTAPIGASVVYEVVGVDELLRRSEPSAPVTLDTATGESDIGGPATPSFESASVYSDTAVGLRWDARPEPGSGESFAGRFDIFLDGEPVATGRRAPNLFFDGLTPGVPATFTIVGIDFIGRRGEPSRPLVIDTAVEGGVVSGGERPDVLPAPRIEDVIVYSDTAIGVRWLAGDDEPRPDVRYDVLVGGEIVASGSVGPATAATGLALAPGVPVVVNVVAVDGDGRRSVSLPFATSFSRGD